MIVDLSRRNIVKHASIGVKFLIIALILFYVLPKLISLLWHICHPDPKIHQEQFLEKPLRVISAIIGSG